MHKCKKSKNNLLHLVLFIDKTFKYASPCVPVVQVMLYKLPTYVRSHKAG